MAFAYDAIARLSSQSNDVYKKTYGYRNISSTQTTTQIQSLSYAADGTSFSPFTLTYAYDAVGNITSVTGSQLASQTASYTYDIQGQLTSETTNGTRYNYTYDTYGNIRSVSGGASHTYTYGDSEWKDLLTAYDGEEIEYDAIGNPESYYNGTHWTFDWEKGRQLASADSSDHEIEYTYDMAGIRDSKTVDGAIYQYLTLSGKVMRQIWTANGTAHTIDFSYDNAGNPYAFKYNGAVYYYVLNQQGDVIRIVDSTGATKAEYLYNAWGKVLSATGTLANINPLRYRGYYYDSETGFYYLQSRYYDPSIGRFINVDSFTSTGKSFLGCNMFAYCNNNAIMGLDPNGDCFHRLDFWNDCSDCGGTTFEDRWNDYWQNGLTGVFTTGVFGSANLGAFDVTGSFEVAVDLKGNVQLIGSGSYDVTTSGSLSASGGITASGYIMPDTSYLAGDTYYTGGGMYVPNPAGMCTVGVSGNVGKTSDGYWGVNGTLGIGTITALGAEFHGGYSRTVALSKQFNVFDVLVGVLLYII